MHRLFVFLGIAVTLSAQYQGLKSTWVEPSSNIVLPASDTFDNSNGTVGIINAAGPVNTEGHPFFVPLGTNGRACVNCHQPTYAMSLSAASMVERWITTGGKDPVFAAFDGSNCPNLPQDQKSSHSLLLNRGLFRIPLPWPPKNSDGSPKPVEFKIEVVRDPTGCNTSAEYGLRSSEPTISVYRRPRPAANLKYVMSGAQAIVLKTGMPADVDPETGKPVPMNLMSDAREPTLKTQAVSAIMGHEQAGGAPTQKQLDKIVEFESQVYAAQIAHIWAGPLELPGGPGTLGPAALRDRRAGVLGDNEYDPVFGRFDNWRKGSDYYRASVARGADIFMFRQFWIRDTAHINSIGLGNPVKRTCATCHNAQTTGQDLSAGWVDVGTTNFPTWTEPSTWAESSELPVFKITCSAKADPHPYLGRVIYTTDPGRALISGRCVDVGSIVMQQLRGLAARPPYFVNGSAKTLREVVDYYDRRFDMKLSDAEKEDLVNFLGAL
ncbi:MAG: hypothetical protein JO307_11340 [Bryobacterales bacterium]|nr:hypothetical protein [Bryobacterales bacterium]MBV9400766.1 hypothetical protein [Bryobacterales bacterium]